MINFLKKVYNLQCEEGDYIVLSAKEAKGKKWRDYFIKYSKKTLTKDLTKFFDSYPSKDYDLYFCVMPFTQATKKPEYVKTSKFLIQDIDEVPIKGVKPKPTYYWESSPKKYQGMWELDRYIDEGQYSLLNEYFAKQQGFDDCFDSVHVYRIPKSINHKYKNTPQVSEVVDTKAIYRLAKFKKDIGYSDKSTVKKKSSSAKISNSSDLTERKIYASYNIPHDILELLALDDVSGLDRSDTIWYIENSLSDIGMSPDEIIYLVKHSTFNKYAGRNNEDKQLRRELMKILSGTIETKTVKKKHTNRLKPVSYGQMRAQGESFQGWLVKGFWGKNTNGIVAGMPKSYKSTLTLDLAMSIASGKPFLNIYPVEETGAVLIIQNENSESILNDRANKIACSKGLGGKVRVKDNSLIIEMPDALPITFINNQGFNLNSEFDCKEFEKLLKKLKPKLVILDPLYLMTTGDINSAQDMTPVLNWLHEMKTKYDTSIMLIHHYNKGANTVASSRGGQRMSGTIFLYGWLESAWYITKEDDEDTDYVQIGMTREFRFAGGYEDLDLQLIMGRDEHDYTYNVLVSQDGRLINDDVLRNTIVDLLKKKGKMNERTIRDELALDKATCRKLLKELTKTNRIVTTKGGYKYNKG